MFDQFYFHKQTASKEKIDLYIQILQPTRITDHSSTLIDNIFFNSIEHFIISGNVVYDLTDHLPNFIIFDKFSTLPLNIKIHKRDYSKLNKEALINDIQSINWHTVFVYLLYTLLNSFYIFPTTATEIETEISSLKDGKACGSYSIPVPVLKILSAVIGKPLEILFNASFSTGIVPSSLKLANVIPVYKKDSQFCLCNYRPISLLSIFNKLLEKLICFRLLDFLEKVIKMLICQFL